MFVTTTLLKMRVNGNRLLFIYTSEYQCIQFIACFTILLETFITGTREVASHTRRTCKVATGTRLYP